MKYPKSRPNLFQEMNVSAQHCSASVNCRSSADTAEVTYDREFIYINYLLPGWPSSYSRRLRDMKCVMIRWLNHECTYTRSDCK